MRVDLNCPFTEKDQAKALGARWDAKRRVWYVVSPPDITLFTRWLLTSPKKPYRRKGGGKPKNSDGPFITIGAAYVESTTDYGDIPPWEDVDDWQAIKALRESCA